MGTDLQHQYYANLQNLAGAKHGWEIVRALERYEMEEDKIRCPGMRTKQTKQNKKIPTGLGGLALFY